MTKSAINEGQRGRALIGLLALAVVLVAGLVFLQPLLKAMLGTSVTSMISAVLAIFMLVYCTRFLLRWHRGLDEVESAGTRFGTHWGGWGGQVLFTVALLLPPFHTFAADMVERFATGSGAMVDPRTVTLTMVFTFAAIMVLQSIAAIVLHATWVFSKR